jgi:hypothetical protein
MWLRTRAHGDNMAVYGKCGRFSQKIKTQHAMKNFQRFFSSSGFNHAILVFHDFSNLFSQIFAPINS